MSYKLKEEEAKKIKAKYKNSYIANQAGISEPYVSLILNRKQEISKKLAYFFTKTINSEYEIDDLFDRVR